jgi:hypothetical protein
MAAPPGSFEAITVAAFAMPEINPRDRRPSFIFI